MMTRFFVCALALAGLALSAPRLAEAQRAASKPTAAEAGGSVPVRWFYPRGERRDPVVPPQVLYSGEGFPSLELSVIVFDPQDEADSHALVLLNGPNPERRVVRAGDRIGRFRIKRVLRDCVRVETSTLGSLRSEDLCLVRDEAGKAPR